MKALYIKIIAILLIGFLLVFNVKQCNHNKNSEKVYKQNIDALTDTIRLTKDKLGNIQYEKLSFIGGIEDIEKLNPELANKIKQQTGKVKYINRIQLKYDTVYVNHPIFIEPHYNEDSTKVTLPFSYNDGIVRFSGKTGFDYLVDNKCKFIIKKAYVNFDSVGLDISIVSGVKESKVNIDGKNLKRYVSFVQVTNSQGKEIKVTGIESAYLDVKDNSKGRFGIDIVGGYGFGLTNQTVKAIPFIGVGIGYRLISF